MKFCSAHVRMSDRPEGFLFGVLNPVPCAHHLPFSIVSQRAWGAVSDRVCICAARQHLLLQSSCSCDTCTPRIAACVPKLNKGAFRKPNRIFPYYGCVYLLFWIRIAGHGHGSVMCLDFLQQPKRVVSCVAARAQLVRDAAANAGIACCEPMHHWAMLPMPSFPFCLHMSWF